MTYNKLMESILTAQEEMLKYCIEANSVTLNGRKYGKLIENCPHNMKPTIFGMAVKADNTMPDDYDFIVQYEPPQPITNADMIRAMTDEELAQFLDKMRRNWTCLPGNDGADCYGSKIDGAGCSHCKECWHEWLRREPRE